ncbi:MVP [Lepeophtheirus salmonis]|uniref:Major vault protein n=2 Tax=Lepeophtheirus salmonis TaxID=72036 RepID=A0A7R8CEV4_LEPSM|nr:MVP [Lepeophtheirus salmonis]CAF2798918.1 MVP [Lepeophtheirus salmonis]
MKRHNMSNLIDLPSFFRIPPFFLHALIPPGSYCVVSNPVITKDGTIEKDQFGQTKLSHGDEEIRLQRDPFPLYPGENLKVEVTPLTIVHSSSALLLKVIRNFTDEDKTERLAGDLYLFEGPGTYFPRKEVEVKLWTDLVVKEWQGRNGWLENLELISLSLKANASFKDTFGVERKNGDQYLITLEDTSSFIPDVQEEILDGKPMLGHRKIVKGEISFFLKPGEILEDGVKEVYILGEDEGIVLKSLVKWMIKGTMEYTPTIEVEVIDVRKAIPLHDNEGIYVRNIQTGSIRSVIADRGEWINPEKEKRAAKTGSTPTVVHDVDLTRVITFKVPHNAAVQVYDYKSRQSRVVYGPDLVMLEPNEEFTQLSLSGGKPKRPNLIRSLALLLELKLSYNWQFKGEKNQDNGAKLFSVPDFIGDMCKSIASKVRGAVSSVSFDNFHKNSAGIIRSAVFGDNDTNNSKGVLEFPTNNLIVTSIDIQSVEPVDQRTRDSLQKSVTLAIEITTQSQEAAAKREAEIIDQEAKGRLERQRITDEAQAEKSRKQLLELQADCAIVEAIGHSSADAKAQAESNKIEAEAKIENSKRKTEALGIEAEAELTRLREARDAEIEYIEKQNKLEIDKQTEIMRLEVEKFKAMVNAVGPQTLLSMSALPREHQIQMLKSLGLKSTLITDGKTPINLIDAAKGLIGVCQETAGK